MRLALSLILFPFIAGAAEAREIAGSLAYREKIALPPSAGVVVEIRDGTGAVIVEDRRPSEGAQVPLPFSLSVDGDAAVTLRAALTVEGAPRWLSAPVAVEAGTEDVDLGSVPLRAFQPMGFASTLRCGDVTVELGFLGEDPRLRIGATYLDLARERTASGAKYVADGDPETWIWTKGHMATLSLNGTELPDCVELLPRTSYRARGNEPGWSLEIANGQMRYLGDYGETEIVAPLPVPEVVEDAVRYAPEGADLVLTLTQTLSHDDMTGMPYPARARLETGGTVLTGTGGDPADLLTAQEWRVEDIGGMGIIDSSHITLRFTPDRRLAGRGGCNRYSGGYELTGEGLGIGPLAATMMACPEALMEQERRFFGVLDSVDGFDFGPDGALWLTTAGTPLITARR